VRVRGVYDAQRRHRRRRCPPPSPPPQVRITNLHSGCHWTELKDFVRKVGDVIYANVENGEG
jgi:hypothetical protein